MVRRYELTDEAWAHIEPLLPAREPRRGGRWRDHRTVLNGILWHLYSGAPWREIPERYGPWQTCYDRFRRWSADGTFDRILAHAQIAGRPDTQDETTEIEVFVDGSVVRAHQHSAGARPSVAELEKGGPAPRIGRIWAGRGAG
jgi:transposase